MAWGESGGKQRVSHLSIPQRRLEGGKHVRLGTSGGCLQVCRRRPRGAQPSQLLLLLLLLRLLRRCLLRQDLLPDGLMGEAGAAAGTARGGAAGGRGRLLRLRLLRLLLLHGRQHGVHRR